MFEGLTISKAKVAQMLGVSKATITQWDKGQRFMNANYKMKTIKYLRQKIKTLEHIIGGLEESIKKSGN